MNTQMPPSTPLPELPPGEFKERSVAVPHANLMKHYFITSLLSGPGIVIALPLLYFKYHTLQYRFDDSGVVMRYGILFKHEVSLTYRRIQDIHVTRGPIQRWLGLASVAVQTASGSAMPEVTFEGILDADGLRDFLYRKMRGARGQGDSPPPLPAPTSTATSGAVDGTSADAADEALVLLREIRDELRARPRAGGAS
ncbi:MAG: PH domain-containing protein [Phycisphaerales bacterium]